jgi:catechol 2,3-dioxygenase-like lactoylglutathione lyase family enzyme
MAPSLPSGGTSDLSTATIGQISIPVKDLDRSVECYRDRLGLPLLFRVPGMAFFGCGSVRLMLGIPEGPGAREGGSILYLKVGDLRAVHAELSRRGVRFLREPHLVARMPDHDLWMSFFEDTEGNTLALMAEERRQT